MGGEMAWGVPRTRCAGSMGCGSGGLFLAVEDFHRKGALPILGGPQTDGSGTAADSQLPRQVRAAGHKEGQLTPPPFSHAQLCTHQPD